MATTTVIEKKLSPVYAEQKRRIAQMHIDDANGFLEPCTKQVSIKPVEIWHPGVQAVLTYEADEQTLIGNGLIKATGLPKARPHSRTRRSAGDDVIATLRLPDGRVRLWISARLVRQCDAGFMKLMTGLEMLVD